MDIRLENDIKRFFSVFRDNTLEDIQQYLPSDSSVQRYQAELESEINLLRTSVLNRLKEEFNR